VLPEEPIHPLKDVWLRPRRVFRQLASRPIGIVDYLLAAAQGVGNVLAFYRTAGAGTHSNSEQMLGIPFLYGAVSGVAGLFVLAVIYVRLGARTGGKATTNQVVHVLAYGGIPMVASLAMWVLMALLAGESTFVATPHADDEGFVALLLYLQFSVHLLLLVWSVVLQVMGLSEIQGLAVRKAFGVWLLGQLIGILVSLFLAMVVGTLFPGILPQLTPKQ
jgi:Yip1 domain